MKTVAQLVEDVNNLVDENFHHTMIVGWFNEALGDLADVARLEAITRTATQSDQSEYTLPPDHYKTVWVFVGGERLEPIDIDSVAAGYHEWGGVLTLEPAPSTTGDPIELYYYRIPTYLSDTELDYIPDIPTRYHHLLVLYAAARTQQRDEDLEEKNDFYRDYLLGKQAYNRETVARVAKHRSLNVKVVR